MDTSRDAAPRGSARPPAVVRPDPADHPPPHVVGGASGGSARSYRGDVDRGGDGSAPGVTAAVTGAAAVAALGVAATMLLAGATALAVVPTLLLVGAQGGLLLALPHAARRTRQFLLAASAEAGLTHLVAGDPTVASALVYLGVGVVFAAIVVAGLALWLPSTDPEPVPEERRGDTAPLPVVDGE